MNEKNVSRDDAVFLTSTYGVAYGVQDYPDSPVRAITSSYGDAQLTLLLTKQSYPTAQGVALVSVNGQVPARNAQQLYVFHYAEPVVPVESALCDWRGYTYEAPRETAARVLAGLTDITGRAVEGEPAVVQRYYGGYATDVPTPGSSATLPRRALAPQYVTDRDGVQYRMAAHYFPETGHARVSFVHGETLDERQRAALTYRGRVILSAILGDGVKFHSSAYDNGRRWLVQGWTR